MTRLDIPYSRHTLANGLDVLVHEDHQLPMVAVNLWYHVGSKDERPGRTGFAHLFEHLMFEGSEHHNASFFQPLERAGAQVNGSTNTDRTNYWEVVPRGALELALWLESDRMGHLLPTLTAERFETQRGVVLNERRQTYENRPYGMASMAMAAALFPAGHPYGWTTIGHAGDIRAATLDDVRDFFRRHYHPANASLAIAGDVGTEEALALAERYFAALPAGPAREPAAPAPPRLAAERRLVIEDRVELPRLYVGWHTPAMFAPGDAALDLAADALANGKTSRLYHALVYHGRLALDVGAHQASRELSSLFQLVTTAASGHGLDELLPLVDDAVARLAEHGPTPDEMERGVARAEAAFLSRLQTIGGFGGKSDQLNAYNVMLGDPGFFGRDLDRYRDATAGDVRAAVREHLAAPHRVLLSVVPQGRADLALAGSERAEVS